MEILQDGARIEFDNTADLITVARFQHFNAIVFDGSLPATEIRWATLHDTQSLCSLYGCLIDHSAALSSPYIFLDERIRDRSLGALADLILIHEMCHFRAPRHDAAFVKEYLRALQRYSWEPLVGQCVTDFRIEDLEN